MSASAGTKARRHEGTKGKKAAAAMAAVYVDPLRSCTPNERWPWRESCHLFVAPGTPLEELHHFAQQVLGLKAGWHQTSRSSGLPHYDLTRGMRAKAIRLGAVELDLHEAGRIFNDWRMRQLVPSLPYAGDTR